MAGTIALWFYELSVRRKGTSVPLKPDEVSCSTREVVSKFLKDPKSYYDDKVAERSWYLTPRRLKSNPNRYAGIINYGMHGFESRIVDRVSRQHQYDRKESDAEEIPLFYDFWFPGDHTHGLMALQSFQGRSCIGSFSERLSDYFSAECPGFTLSLSRLIPFAGGSAIYGDKPVKRLRLISARRASNAATRYGIKPDKPVEIEVRITAGRKEFLGNLRDVGREYRNSDGVLLYDGISFDQAYADVKVGKRTRSVGVFGASDGAGGIDITEDVKRLGGHPTFASVSKESADLMKTFHERLYPGVV